MAGECDPRVQMAVGAWGMEGGKGGVTHRATEVLPPRSRAQGQTVHATKPVVMKGKLETGAGQGTSSQSSSYGGGPGPGGGKVPTPPWEPSNNNGAG